MVVKPYKLWYNEVVIIIVMRNIINNRKTRTHKTIVGRKKHV